MSEKRKDSKGRILKTGESQRKNGTYEYRYNDPFGKRGYVYAKTLADLRLKESEIIRDIADGINTAAGEMKVTELVDRYMFLKRDLRKNTLRAYSTPIKRIRNSAFGQMKIKDVKISTAKEFYITLHDEGIKRNTIVVYQNVLHPAFEMAVDDDIIRKNPFKFKVSDILPDDAEKRTALSKAEQKEYIDFIREYGNENYIDDIVLLLETGLRVSELYGLTRKDIDFENRCIRVDHQLCRTGDKPYFISSPKTGSGNRFVPMTDVAYMTLKRIIGNRKSPKTELIVDGYSGFLFLDKDGMPKVAMHLEGYMRRIQAKYKRIKKKSFPRVTPHVLRHTFCTNMQRVGIDVKSLQYIMGHSNVSVTLDIYTHTDFSNVRCAFDKVSGYL